MTDQRSPIRELLSGSQPKLDLSYILAQAKTSAPLADRIQWFHHLLGWLRPLEAARSEHEIDRDPQIRLRFLVQLLRRHVEWQKPFAEVLIKTLDELSALSLFAYAGLPEQQGFVDQISTLWLDIILPPAPDQGDLSKVLRTLFIDVGDADWIREIPDETLSDFCQLLALDKANYDGLWQGYYHELLDALLVLATQIAAISSSRSIWDRSQRPSPETSPAFRLLQKTQSLIATFRPLKVWEPFHLISLQMLQEEASEVQRSLEQALHYVEEHGVNLGLVFRMEHAAQLLGRFSLLCECLQSLPQHKARKGVSTLLANLLASQYSAQSFHDIWQQNIRRLARRMVEHAGHSGEHYVTRTRKEYRKLLLSAGGGGMLTVGTCLIKAAVSKLQAPLLTEAFLHAGNYAGSFLSMQALHLTLATKQPSVTAPHLAVLLSRGSGEEKGLGIVDEIRHVVRSQLAAALGNIGMAIPTAMTLAYLMRHWFGKRLFPEDIAHYTIASLHPWHSFTLFYAALTGVLLWLSSLSAAWLENWIDFHQIPERLSSQRFLDEKLGPGTGAKWAEKLRKHVAGAAGSIFLGMSLALIPFLGKVTGLPLDVRHVTLAAAQLSVALVSVPQAWTASECIAAWSGVVCVGLLNFGVSFALALTLAMRAQNVPLRRKRAVRRALLRLIRREPWSFIWPPRDNTTSEETGSPSGSHALTDKAP